MVKAKCIDEESPAKLKAKNRAENPLILDILLLDIPMKEKVIGIDNRIKEMALQVFRNGDFENPFGQPDAIFSTELQKICADEFQFEMSKLIKERGCPCCGQPTSGDIDF